MYHTSLSHKIDILNVNNQVDKAKKKHIKKYNHELSEYIDEVTRKALYKIADNPNFEKLDTEAEGDFDDDLGKLLLNPPSLGDLSLPDFMENDSSEVINLPKGFLFIEIDKENRKYHLVYHVDTMGPYLDSDKTISKAFPTLVRGISTASGGALTISRIYSLLKLLPFFK